MIVCKEMFAVSVAIAPLFVKSYRWIKTRFLVCSPDSGIKPATTSISIHSVIRDDEGDLSLPDAWS